MTDKMIPISFEELLGKLIREYKESKTFMQVPVKRIMDDVPIGPAAGPHTQMAGNIVAAYAAGASYFELKTVQILEGEELQIKKPCIYVGHEVFNTEWSTELTVEEAQNEYIKAYLLIMILAKEFNLGTKNSIHFIMSVGYDLEGIKSLKVDTFLNNMIDARNTAEWKNDIEYVKENLNLFQNIKEEYIENISPNICNTVTLSTMHGCKSDEIEKIALYLINEKNLNTYIKMNPTLAGKEKIQEILAYKGYKNIHFKNEIFEKDITLENAVEMIKNVKKEADKKGNEFGIKLTNTFPVIIENNELDGEDMYMSGPALYPISIYVAYLLAEKFQGEIPISYSGGIDVSNISEILDTGIKPVTLSSFLLKQGGYKNITRLVEKIDSWKEKKSIDADLLKKISEDAEINMKYDWKETKIRKTNCKEYSSLCSVCNNCVDVCPNRANVKVTIEDKKYVVHRDRLCNECGCCTFSCAMGHIPYKEKIMLTENEKQFEICNGSKVLYIKNEGKYKFDEHTEKIKEWIKNVIKAGYEKGCF